MYTKKNPAIYRTALKAHNLAFDEDLMVSETDADFGKRIFAALEKSGDFSKEELVSLKELLKDSSLMTKGEALSGQATDQARKARQVRSDITSFNERFGTDRIKPGSDYFEFPHANRLR